MTSVRSTGLLLPDPIVSERLHSGYDLSADREDVVLIYVHNHKITIRETRLEIVFPRLHISV